MNTNIVTLNGVNGYNVTVMVVDTNILVCIERTHTNLCINNYKVFYYDLFRKMC